ncbi:MAG: hypothetical protein V2A76_09785 [Planctomycetota bacterium]
MKRIGPLGLLLMTMLSGCMGPDRDLPDPIEPVNIERRTPVIVRETLNESPIAVVAELTDATRAMLERLLERTGRFEACAEEQAARYYLETAIVAFQDDDASEGVIFGQAKSIGHRRRAVVEMTYRLLDQGQGVFLDGLLRGDTLVTGVDRLEVPTVEQVESGAYWNSPFGLATRDCLDRLVRDLSDVF